MTLVTDDKEKLIQAIQKNNELKPASLDIVDSKRLQIHQQNFQYQQNIDYVIQQKIFKEDFTKDF